MWSRGRVTCHVISAERLLAHSLLCEGVRVHPVPLYGLYSFRSLGARFTEHRQALLSRMPSPNVAPHPGTCYETSACGVRVACCTRTPDPRGKAMCMRTLGAPTDMSGSMSCSIREGDTQYREEDVIGGGTLGACYCGRLVTSDELAIFVYIGG